MNRKYMKAVDYENCGSSEVLKVVRKEIPRLKNDEVLIEIVATTVTDFDIWRRKHRKPRPGIDPLLGMECSGEIVALGSNQLHHRLGDKVCALLGGGGYAEYVAVPSWRVIPIPNRIRFDHAATLPNVASVVWNTLFRVGKLKENCSILIHDGAGEYGQLAIQLAILHGCTVFASAMIFNSSTECELAKHWSM